MSKDTFSIYSDESGISSNNFQAIGLISGFKKDFEVLDNDLGYILKIYSKKSIEYKDINGDSNRKKCAIDFITKTIESVCSLDMKIDVIIWNMKDSRHSIKNRNEELNYKIMYYKVLSKCSDRWGLSKINFYPDETTCINWNYELKPFLKNTNINKKYTIQNNVFDIDIDGRNLEVKILEKQSCLCNLIQAIDIITGLARMSYCEGYKIYDWLIKQGGQLSLFEADENKLSRGQTSKYEVFKVLLDLCKNNQKGISFNKDKHLKTFKSTGKLNFWYYQPQHKYDKAPTK